MDKVTAQQLDEYEEEESYTLEYVEPLVAIRKNRNTENNPRSLMLEREARVLETLIEDGLLI